MKYNEFDKKYYVMNVDGANNHPILAWGSTSKSPFLKAQPIEEEKLSLPLEVLFAEPYPAMCEMADFLLLGAQFAASQQLKSLIEELNIYGMQFFPLEIKSNKGEIITNHFLIHYWNRLSAIDKNNYDGEEPNMFGNILRLNKFSLDETLLSETPLEKRKIFTLSEKNNMVIIHKTVHEALVSANLTGIRFFRVDEWNSNVMF